MLWVLLATPRLDCPNPKLRLFGDSCGELRGNHVQVGNVGGPIGLAAAADAEPATSASRKGPSATAGGFRVQG